MEAINSELMNFIDKTPNAFYCIENLKKELLSRGYIELSENDVWDNLQANGNYFVIRNGTSLIAFSIPEKISNQGFNITATHSDSPSFTIKPHAEIFDGNYLRLNTNDYGGMINYSWLDRPLSLSGRVMIKNNNSYESRLINFDKDILLIPSQAIHINRDVNEHNPLNFQVDMLPVMALDNNKSLEDAIRESLKTDGRICDYDLFLYCRDRARYVGLNNEMIISPRLDDLASVYPAFKAFVESANDEVINVLSVFDNEEIGSLSRHAADSTFLIDVLTRITSGLNLDLLSSLKKSFIISADNAHAIHPAASSKSDPTNVVLLNKGVVVKHHKNYTTDAVSSTIYKAICDNAGVMYQDFACRSDLKCGSTLGKISQRHVSIDSVDIGLPQLAMHSTVETIGSKDVLYMYKSLLEFYNSRIVKEKDYVKILHK